LRARDIVFTTQDGLSISGWYIPGRKKDTVLVVEGWGQNRNKALPYTALFAAAGYTVLTFDFRGQGASADGFCSLGVRESQEIASAVEYLVQKRIKNIMLFGVSMGGHAILRYMAAAPAPEVSAVILDSVYASPYQMLKSVLAFKFPALRPVTPILAWGAFTLSELVVGPLPAISSAQLQRVRVPVLLLHGANDREIELAQALFLKQAIPNSVLRIIPQAVHAAAYRAAPQMYRQYVFDFLRAR
jgi:pimeloyl-ACP methyl ester carboxylesterase